MRRQRAAAVCAEKLVQRCVLELDDNVELFVVDLRDRALVAVGKLSAARRHGSGRARSGRLGLEEVGQVFDLLALLFKILLHGLRLVLRGGDLVLERRDFRLEVFDLGLRLLQLVLEGGLFGCQLLDFLGALLELDPVQADLLRQFVVVGHELLEFRADARQLLARLAEFLVLLGCAVGDGVDKLLRRAGTLRDEAAGIRLVRLLVAFRVQCVELAELRGLRVAPLHELHVGLLKFRMVVLKKVFRIGIVDLARLAGGDVLLGREVCARSGVLGLDEGRQLDDAVSKLLVAILQQFLLLKQVQLEIQRDAGDSQNHVDERVYSLVHVVFYLLSDRFLGRANLVRAVTVE